MKLKDIKTLNDLHAHIMKDPNKEPIYAKEIPAWGGRKLGLGNTQFSIRTLKKYIKILADNAPKPTSPEEEAKLKKKFEDIKQTIEQLDIESRGKVQAKKNAHSLSHLFTLIRQLVGHIFEKNIKLEDIKLPAFESTSPEEDTQTKAPDNIPGKKDDKVVRIVNRKPVTKTGTGARTVEDQNKVEDNKAKAQPRHFMTVFKECFEYERATSDMKAEISKIFNKFVWVDNEPNHSNRTILKNNLEKLKTHLGNEKLDCEQFDEAKAQLLLATDFDPAEFIKSVKAPQASDKTSGDTSKPADASQGAGAASAAAGTVSGQTKIKAGQFRASCEIMFRNQPIGTATLNDKEIEGLVNKITVQENAKIATDNLADLNLYLKAKNNNQDVFIVLRDEAKEEAFWNEIITNKDFKPEKLEFGPYLNAPNFVSFSRLKVG